jgi:hypothetical protein
MGKKGICPVCGKGPKGICYLHPETRENICKACYQKLTGKSRFHKRGICSICRREKAIPYLHPKTKQNICDNCYRNYRKTVAIEWFQNLSDFEAAGWIVDTVLSRENQRIKRLNLLVKTLPERLKALCKLIQSPSTPHAAQILNEFLQTQEGKTLKKLLEKGRG